MLALMQNILIGFHDSLIHLSFVQCEQVRFRPKKKVKVKVTHSVVAGTGGGGNRIFGATCGRCCHFNIYEQEK